MVRAIITGTGSYLPQRVVTNDELAERMPKTSDEWIYSHTGIHARHIAAPDESPSDMGMIAAQRAMEQAGVGPDDLGMIIVSTATPDYAPTPLTSCILQERLGSDHASAFDMSAACCGFIYNLEIAKWYARKFADYLTENANDPKIFEYPKSDRLVTDDGRSFFDS